MPKTGYHVHTHKCLLTRPDEVLLWCCDRIKVKTPTMTIIVISISINVVVNDSRSET